MATELVLGGDISLETAVYRRCRAASPFCINNIVTARPVRINMAACRIQAACSCGELAPLETLLFCTQCNAVCGLKPFEHQPVPVKTTIVFPAEVLPMRVAGDRVPFLSDMPANVHDAGGSTNQQKQVFATCGMYKGG